MDRVVTGTYTGTGAAVVVSLGFKPSKIEVYNDTDGDERWVWLEGMAAASAYKVAADGTQTKITSNGISAYAGTRGGNSIGFTVGTALSEDTKVFRYVAYRGG